MKSVHVLEGITFHEAPHAHPVFFDHNGRILRFVFKPGQVLREHASPSSPVYIVVLQGRGMFAGSDGIESEFGPNSLIVFDAGERHAVRALDEDLVFLAFLHGAPGISGGHPQSNS